MNQVNDGWFFDRVAPVYDVFVWHHSYDDILDMLDLGHGTTVLDLGGGTGRLVDRLVSDHPSCRGMVLDVSQPMLEKGLRQSRKGKPVRGRGESIPLASGSVDRVLMTDALHHLSRPREVFREIQRVLKPGGILVTEEFDTSTMCGWVISTGERLMGLDSRFWSPMELTETLKFHGLECKEVRESGFVYYASFRL